MAAAKERGPGDQEEEEVSATVECCSAGGGGDGRAGCMWGRESGWCLWGVVGDRGPTGAASASRPGTRGARERPASALPAPRRSEWGEARTLP